MVLSRMFMLFIAYIRPFNIVSCESKLYSSLRAKYGHKKKERKKEMEIDGDIFYDIKTKTSMHAYAKLFIIILIVMVKVLSFSWC